MRRCWRAASARCRRCARAPGVGRARGAGQRRSVLRASSSVSRSTCACLHRRIFLRARACRAPACRSGRSTVRFSAPGGAQTRRAGAACSRPRRRGHRAEVRQGRQARGDRNPSPSRRRWPRTRSSMVLPAGLKGHERAGRSPTRRASRSLSGRHRRCAADRQVRCRAPSASSSARGGPPLLPVTLRHVQGDLRPQRGESRAASCVRAASTSDAEVLAWYAKVLKHHETRLSAKELGRPQREWFDTVEERDAKGLVPAASTKSHRSRMVAARHRHAGAAPRSAATSPAATRGLRGGRHSARAAGLPRGRDRIAPPRRGAARQAGARCSCARRCSPPISACT